MFGVRYLVIISRNISKIVDMCDLRSINRGQFEAARRYWFAANILKSIAYLVGVCTVFWANILWFAPIILLVMAILSDLVQFASDFAKSKAEFLLKLLDLNESFGRSISPMDKRDTAYIMPFGNRKQYQWEDVDGAYFASRENIGPKKAIENLRESAWYTRQQAFVMGVAHIGIIFVVMLVSVIAVMITAREVQDTLTTEKIVKVVTSALLLMISLNMFRGGVLYYRLYMRSKNTEINCDYLLKQEITQDDAMKQWGDYQAVRANSPLLPSWLWKVMGQWLKRRWTQYVMDSNV